MARGKEGVRETRVKSKSQQESPWTSAVCRSASPASLFVRVRRRTRFLRTCTSGLAKIHPVRVYLGPRVIYTRWLKLNISTEEGRGREGGRNEGARGGGKEGGDGDDGSGGDDGEEAEPRELCRKIEKTVLPQLSLPRTAVRSIAGPKRTNLPARALLVDSLKRITTSALKLRRIYPVRQGTKRHSTERKKIT